MSGRSCRVAVCFSPGRRGKGSAVRSGKERQRSQTRLFEPRKCASERATSPPFPDRSLPTPSCERTENRHPDHGGLRHTRRIRYRRRATPGVRRTVPATLVGTARLFLLAHRRAAPDDSAPGTVAPPRSGTLGTGSCKTNLGNDPSAGSPTETLLRLLLPLNDQV